MFYYLYEIKNQVNNKVYVGVHKTKSMDDGYMGSGKVILSAIKKHGVENFTKVILETFDNSEDMFRREKEVVTDEFLARADTYNLRRGGFGGFDYINNNMLDELHEARSILYKKLGAQVGPDSVRKMHQTRGENGSYKNYNNPFKNPILQAEMHRRNKSPEAIEKRKETFKKIGHQQGEKNSNFGKYWITNESDSKMISKDSPIPEGWKKGRIRKKLCTQSQSA